MERFDPQLELEGFRFELVLRQYSRPATRRADAVLFVVEIDGDVIPDRQIAPVFGGREVLGREPVGAEMEQRISADHEPIAAIIAKRNPSHIAPVAVLLRVNVRGMQLVNWPAKPPDLSGHARVRVAFSGPESEPFDVGEVAGNRELKADLGNHDRPFPGRFPMDFNGYFAAS